MVKWQQSHQEISQLWRLLDPALGSEQVQLQQVAWNHVRLILSHHDTYLCQCITTIMPERIFSSVKVEFPVFQYVPVASCRVNGNCREEPHSLLFSLPIRYS